MQDYVELRKVLDSTKKWLWLLILTTVITAGIGYLISQRQPRVYLATSTIMVGEFIQATELSRTDLLTSEVLAQTYADMALRQPVLQAVVDTLDLPVSWRTLRNDVRVHAVEGTQLLEIEVEAASSQQARTIADAVAQQLILLSPTAVQNQRQAEAHDFVNQRLENLQAKMELAQERLDDLEQAMVQSQSAQQIVELQNAVNTFEGLISNWERNYVQMLSYVESETPSNSLTIIEPAQSRSQPIRPRPYLYTVLAGAIGLAFSLGLAFALEFLDEAIRTTDDIRRISDIRVLGAISRIDGDNARDKLLLAQDPDSSAAEAYRIVRTNIEFGTGAQLVQSIVITSPGPGEGKSTTAANLGIIMAQAGFPTIIVDADLRQPAQHKLFQTANSRGLAEAIQSPELDISNLLIDTREDNLQVLPSGEVPSRPAELLGSRGMRDVLEQLPSLADVIIIDSPPILGLTDAGILANRADAVVLVIESGRTHWDAGVQAIVNLQQAGANLIGAVLNRGELEHQKYYSYSRRPIASGKWFRARLSSLWQRLTFS